MRLLWSTLALLRLRQLHDHIALEQPAAAQRIVRRIQDTAIMLTKFPNAARPLRRKSMSVFTVPKTKYLLIVRIEPDVLTVATVLHGAEDWEQLYPQR